MKDIPDLLDGLRRSINILMEIVFQYAVVAGAA